MKEIKYQQKAVKELVDKTIDLLNRSGNRKRIVFSAPTGSGKTVMASEMLQTLSLELPTRSDVRHNQVAFIWIAPNKLHEQSYFKMKNFFTESRVLHPVLFDELDHTEGYIQPGEILFVNWESINKENAVMIRENEHGCSLYNVTRSTQIEHQIPIIVIIDEEHMFGGKNAKKSENVLKTIDPKIEIRISATPITNGDETVKVYREDVVKEEMIKEGILLNPAITSNFNDDRTLNEHLLNTALKKRNELAEAYQKLGVSINPLLLIQLPNDQSEALSEDDKTLIEQIEAQLNYCHGINYDNERMAVWLSGNKRNLDGIENNNSHIDVLLFKQAIALGWDCPRAAVLLIFRKLNSFSFTVQTVGRILRMPEQKFYTDDRLNKGYVYTDLSADQIEIVADDLDYISTLRAVRREYLQNVLLPSTYVERKSSDRNRLGPDFKKLLEETFIRQWGLNGNPRQLRFSFDDEGQEAPEDEANQNRSAENRNIARSQKNIRFDVKSIQVEIPEDVLFEGSGEESIKIENKAKFAKSAGELKKVYYHHCRSFLAGFELSHSTDVLANYISEVLENLFEVFGTDAPRVVLYHENKPKFSEIISLAVGNYKKFKENRRKDYKSREFIKYDWEVPEDRIYNEESNEIVTDVKIHAMNPFIRLKNASKPEKDFEAFLEANKQYIDWWYKNGDEGKQHYAIEYLMNDETKGLFYIDFVIRMKNGHIYLFDTKTEGSDLEAPYKHNALIDYLEKEFKDKNVKGGILIYDHDNWKYSSMKIENTTNLLGWQSFQPDLA